MITAYKKDESKVLLRCDDSGVLMELSEYFTFYAEGYKFMPAYRNKMWDGKYAYTIRDHTQYLMVY